MAADEDKGKEAGQGMARGKHTSGRESDTIRAARITRTGVISTALITASMALIGVILGLVFKSGNSTPSGGSLGNQPQISAPSSSQPSDLSPAPTGSKSSFSAPALAITVNPANGTLMYKNESLVLDNDGCVNHNNYPSVAFGPDGLEPTLSSPSPPSGTFAITLYCSLTSSGSGLYPNIAYGGHAAILSAHADFNSCYSAVFNSPVRHSIPFKSLRSGVHLCILYNNELALVTLLSVIQAEYRVTGIATVWNFMTSN